MSSYAIILASAIFFPLILSFDKKVAFWRSWPRACMAAFIVALPFIVWDEIATMQGSWSFSPAHVWAFRLGGLPLEELFFFLVAPVACVFIHACVKAYVKPLPIVYKPWPFFIAAALCIGLIFPVFPRFYTATLLGFTAVFFILCGLMGKKSCADARFWLSLLICYLPFLLVNGFLTGIPVVLYSPGAILGPRVLTIPIEDFLYSLALVGSVLLVFEALERRGGDRARA